MVEIARCPECDIAQQIADEHLWLNSGVIVLKSDERLRMAFAETENLDPLYQGIEELIGVPIQRFLVDIERKGTRDYFIPLIPREIKDMVQRHEISLDPIIDAVIITNITNGLGHYEPVSYRYEIDDEDYITVLSYDTHCLPLAMGDIAGGCEAVVEREYSDVTYKEISPRVYEMTARVAKVPKGLKGRLERKEYQHRDGDIEFKRCPSCGAPAALAEFKWNSETGIIRSALNGRRMGVIHPSVLDPIFEELEAELGESIPAAVVEAQRRFTKTGFHTVEEISDIEGFRGPLALRGMGNLRELEMSGEGLRMQLDNPCMHLIIVGMMQGLFELAFDSESSVEWELSPQDTLRIEVKPRTTLLPV